MLRWESIDNAMRARRLDRSSLGMQSIVHRSRTDAVSAMLACLLLLPGASHASSESGSSEKAASACTQPRSALCELPANDPAIASTADVFFSETAEQCTATLVADVPRSQRLFLITAGHCVGFADAGTSLRGAVTFGATSACGTTERGRQASYQSIEGVATVRARVDDIALVELDRPAPPAAYFSGLDLTGGSGRRESSFALMHVGSRALQWVTASTLALSRSEEEEAQTFLYSAQSGVIGPGASGAMVRHAKGPLAGYPYGILVSVFTDSGNRGNACALGDGYTVAGFWKGASGEASNSLAYWLDPENRRPQRIEGYRSKTPYPLPKPGLTVDTGLGPGLEAEFIAGAGPYSLSWSPHDAADCTATGNWGGDRDIGGGFVSIPAIRPGDYRYRLTCTNPGGQATETVRVRVRRPPGEKSQAVLPWRRLKDKLTP